MAAVTICNDFGAPKIKSVTVSPSICHEVMGLDAMILVFWMLSFKPTFSLSSFTHQVSFIFVSIEPSTVSWWSIIIQWINELIKEKGNEKKSETKQKDKEENKIKIFLAQTKPITTVVRNINIAKINQLSFPYLRVISSIDEGELIDMGVVLVSWLVLRFPGETFGSPFLCCLLFIGPPGHSPYTVTPSH